MDGKLSTYDEMVKVLTDPEYKKSLGLRINTDIAKHLDVSLKLAIQSIIITRTHDAPNWEAFKR